MASVYVVKPGLLTTVQDRGRWGSQSFGVSVSGAMDVYSHRLANALAGNDADAATLEVTIAGPELEFDDARTVAVTGAVFEVTVDHRPIDLRSAVDVSAGSIMRFGRRIRGSRCVRCRRRRHRDAQCVRKSGDASAEPDWRPRRARFEIWRPITAGRVDSTLAPRHDSPVAESSAAWTLPDGRATLRVLPGPQLDRFLPDCLGRAAIESVSFATDSNRMGYRLVGPSLETGRTLDVISDATPTGALQVPASGQPILLMADRQTTGGYPKIASVISADISVAGQLGPGDTVTFVACSATRAAALIAQERSLMAASGRP